MTLDAGEGITGQEPYFGMACLVSVRYFSIEKSIIWFALRAYIEVPIRIASHQSGNLGGEGRTSLVCGPYALLLCPIFAALRFLHKRGMKPRYNS